MGYPAYGQPAQSGTNGLAIASLVCGILSIPSACVWGLGILFGIAAIIMGIIAMKQTKQTGQDGNGMALAGLITGVVGLLLSIVLLVLIIIGLSIDPSSSDYLLSLLR
ncbi:DUF4190 domain-containing protein [Tsukamurella strandjordii]|uniref:DUF4190 domain-containing protein n=1 Tax=Tsukamurella strandjordii TaxID=147577 RepID=UPI0039F14968